MTTQKDKSNLDLLNELGVEAKTKKQAKRTPREERIIAGFEEIQRFVEEHGNLPAHGEGNDIFERLYAVRLDQLKKQADSVELLSELDHQGLLDSNDQVNEPKGKYESDAAMLDALGVKPADDSDITQLKHVKPRAEIRAAEEIGQRTPCPDFDKYKPLFDQIQADIKSGVRKTIQFKKDGSIEKGNWFILGGQKAYVADIGEEFKGSDGRREYRLRVIFDNGVESNQLMRSLQKRLWEDDTGRRISEISAGPLFENQDDAGDSVLSGSVDQEDLESGTIYVLRSKSDHPTIAENRDLIHKIGVTGGDVKKRFTNAKLDPTFLMADVEIVATYELYNINRNKLEKLIHRFFEPARLQIEIPDRFGNKVSPREWFLVPVNVIDEAVNLIRSRDITKYNYSPNSATLMQLRDL